jgi:hypothetical protein
MSCSGLRAVPVQTVQRCEGITMEVLNKGVAVYSPLQCTSPDAEYSGWENNYFSTIAGGRFFHPLTLIYGVRTFGWLERDDDSWSAEVHLGLLLERDVISFIYEGY